MFINSVIAHVIINQLGYQWIHNLAWCRVRTPNTFEPSTMAQANQGSDVKLSR